MGELELVYSLVHRITIDNRRARLFRFKHRQIRRKRWRRHYKWFNDAINICDHVLRNDHPMFHQLKREDINKLFETDLLTLCLGLIIFLLKFRNHIIVDFQRHHYAGLLNDMTDETNEVSHVSPLLNFWKRFWLRLSFVMPWCKAFAL